MTTAKYIIKSADGVLLCAEDTMGRALDMVAMLTTSGFPGCYVELETTTVKLSSAYKQTLPKWQVVSSLTFTVCFALYLAWQLFVR